MKEQETLCCMGVLYMLMSTLSMDTQACGVFMFETPTILNGTLCVQERAKVNITFTVRHSNCSATSGDIEISKYKNVFHPICLVLPSCTDRPAIGNIYCSCLDTPGFYTFTFIADRKHNTLWRFSVNGGDVKDAFVMFNILYPSRVTEVEILGNDTYIPRHTFVTVVCFWENGNPPSIVRLLDRHNTLLDKGDKTGNISYTFSHVECNHAGVIRCEADGSERNVSINMLIECPPEFVKNTSNTSILTIGLNADVTFPFRSPTTNVTSCRIIMQNRNVATNTFLTVVLNCTKEDKHASTFIQENKHCLYSVTGEPPDLLLTIHVRHLTRQDSGLWHVTLSNDEGNGEIYLQVNVEDGSALGHINKDEVIIGITSSIVIILIIACIITQGKQTYSRFKNRKSETVLHETPISDRQSEIYYEIPDTLLETSNE